MADSGKGCSETNNSALVHLIVFQGKSISAPVLMALPVESLVSFGSSSVKDSYFWQLEAQKEVASFREAIK